MNWINSGRKMKDGGVKGMGHKCLVGQIGANGGVGREHIRRGNRNRNGHLFLFLHTLP